MLLTLLCTYLTEPNMGLWLKLPLAQHGMYVNRNVFHIGGLKSAIAACHVSLSLHLDRVKRIWYLSPMRAAKVQASLRIRAVSPEPSLLAHTSSESRGIFRQKARSQASLNGWACAVKICHDGMLEDTNSLDGAHLIYCNVFSFFVWGAFHLSALAINLQHYFLSLKFCSKEIISIVWVTIYLNCFLFNLNVLYKTLNKIWDLIVSVPDHCLSFYFPTVSY